MAICDSDEYSWQADKPFPARMFKFFDNDQDASESARRHSAGEVRFDERGNAIYAWRDAKLTEENQRAEKLRERALLHPGLALVDDVPPPDQPVVRNDKGARLGYNPYESGQLTNKPKADKKRDMRELSKWIELKRRLAAQVNGSEE